MVDDGPGGCAGDVVTPIVPPVPRRVSEAERARRRVRRARHVRPPPGAGAVRQLQRTAPQPGDGGHVPAAGGCQAQRRAAAPRCHVRRILPLGTRQAPGRLPPRIRRPIRRRGAGGHAGPRRRRAPVDGEDGQPPGRLPRAAHRTLPLRVRQVHR